MNEAPEIVLVHRLRAQKLPTFLRKHQKRARQCAAEDVDHVRCPAQLAELKLLGAVGGVTSSQGNRSMIYGFVGTGTITEAMVTGLLASALPFDKIVVSPRGAAVAARLHACSGKVVIAPSNQAVVDEADVIVLALRYQVAEAVLAAITFPPDRTLISVIAATSHEKLSAWTGYPTDDIIRAIPLPFVAHGEGVSAVYPANATAEALFNGMGVAVPCKTKEDFDLLAVTTSTMGTFFGIMEGIVDWLAENGMGRDTAQGYVAPLFHSLVNVALRTPGAEFGLLRQEYSTPGGLNEQVFRNFVANGGQAALQDALDKVLARIRG